MQYKQTNQNRALKRWSPLERITEPIVSPLYTGKNTEEPRVSVGEKELKDGVRLTSKTDSLKTQRERLARTGMSYPRGCQEESGSPRTSVRRMRTVPPASSVGNESSPPSDPVIQLAIQSPMPVPWLSGVSAPSRMTVRS